MNTIDSEIFSFTNEENHEQYKKEAMEAFRKVMEKISRDELEKIAKGEPIIESLELCDKGKTWQKPKDS